jgi:hypothetical protein
MSKGNNGFDSYTLDVTMVIQNEPYERPTQFSNIP